MVLSFAAGNVRQIWRRECWRLLVARDKGTGNRTASLNIHIFIYICIIPVRGSTVEWFLSRWGLHCSSQVYSTYVFRFPHYIPGPVYRNRASARYMYIYGVLTIAGKETPPTFMDETVCRFEVGTSTSRPVWQGVIYRAASVPRITLVAVVTYLIQMRKLCI